LRGRAFGQRQADAGIGVAELAHERPHDRVEGGGRREAEVQMTRLAASGPLRVQRRVLDVAQQPLGVDQQRLAGVGRHDAVSGAVEQPDVELPFQRVDLLAQRRLADAEPFRRARDIAFLGDGDEVA
jgi:hypothetical protein